MKRLVILTVLVFSAGSAHGARFTPGDVFAKNFNGEVWNVTGGGDFTAAPLFTDVGSSNIGDAAWSADLSTMYVSNVNDNTVYAVTPAGGVTPFATGLAAPLGLLTAQDGRLLVADFRAGVVDITAGGDFTGASPFASGLSNPIDLAQTPDGNIYVTEETSGEVSNITAGGAIGPAHVLASGVAEAAGLVATPAGNGLMAAAPGSSSVFAITSAGVMTTFASGRQVHGVAYTPDGRLLASDNGFNAIYDLTAGGDMAAAPVFARVTDVANVAVVPVPEPAGLAALAIAASAALLRRRARR